MAKAENFERELSTQKEIMKQMEITKREYIQKLKKELDTIEQRYHQIINENSMIGEDFRSQAFHNLGTNIGLNKVMDEREKEIDSLKKTIEERDLTIIGYERSTASL